MIYFCNEPCDLNEYEFWLARSPVYSLLGTTLEGLTCIKVFGVQDMFHDWFTERKDIHSSTYVMYIGSYSWLLSTLNWLALSFEVMVVLSFVLFVKGKLKKIHYGDGMEW